ncbi:hypothetical protein BJV74DRAFT_886229 [Russula compacta]|nr:hypothetical protein BJV74DRAFT_886229 [Russula compacta]
MTPPTQALPSWLSYSTSLATNAAGKPTATFTTVINLPLTYFGPSIPLGPDSIWVYGGLSSPVPSSSNPTNSLPTSSGSAITSSPSATPTSPSAIPSTTSPSPSSTLAIPPPTTSSTNPSLSPSSPSSSLSPSSTSSSPISGEASHVNHAGLIVGSVLGSLIGSLLLLFAFIFFMRQRQRRQPQRSHRPEPPTSQVMWMWHDVHRSDDEQDADLDAELRSPGDASAQTSGDENDAFLRPSGEAYYDARETTSSPRLVDAPRTSRDSSGPIGVALSQGSKPSVPSPGRRHIISREQLAELSRDLPPNPDSSRSPEEGDLGPDSPLLPPPPVSHGSRRSLLPSERSMTPGNDPESALLYTAQRVQVGGRSTPSSPETPWAEGIGVPSILRRSWLNPRTRSATSTTSSPKSSFLGRQLTDNELEAGRNHSAQMRSEMGYREGARPISSVSAMSTTSGNTLFYDAQSREDLSSLPPPVPPVPPLPQGTASTGRSGLPGPSPLSAEPIRASHESEKPPTYEFDPPEIREPDDAVDYLDVPIPRPASPFASVSSANRITPPPGLGVPDSTPEAAPSSDLGDAINIELLEEDPPAAAESWRQISLGLPSLHERRMTFGLMPSTIVYPRELAVSEHGSLHSMRSHFSPHTALSASGSAPASNSNSGHSRGFTVASSLRSLAHSSSISSTDRRLARRGPGEVSPPLSAIGRRTATSVSPPPRGAYGGNLSPSLVPPPAATAAPHHAQSATVTSTATRSSVTTHTSMTDPITGEVVRYPHPAWTGGRDHPLEEASGGSDGVRLPPPPSAWDGSWSSPSHLRALQTRVAGRENASHA